MGAVRAAISGLLVRSSGRVAKLPPARRRPARGGEMPDLLYVGLTIAVFAVLTLLVKGVERLER